MRVTIKRVTNGYVIREHTADASELPQDFCYEGESGFGSDDKGEVRNFIKVLYHLIDYFSPGNTGRYSIARPSVIMLPGDKFEGEISDEYYDELFDLKERISIILEEQDLYRQGNKLVKDT